MTSATSGLSRRDRAEPGAERDPRKRLIYRQLGSVSSSNVVPSPQGRARVREYVSAAPQDAESRLRAMAPRPWVRCDAFRQACGVTYGITLSVSQRDAPHSHSSSARAQLADLSPSEPCPPPGAS